MKQHYFLLAVQVIYQKDKLERSRNFNILITSNTKTVNRAQLGRAQQQSQVRYFTEFDNEQKSNVVDVFIQGVSHLGEMTEAEFHGDFDYPGKSEAEPVTDTSVENDADGMADPAPETTDSEPLTETPVEDVTKEDN